MLSTRPSLERVTFRAFAPHGGVRVAGRADGERRLSDAWHAAHALARRRHADFLGSEAALSQI
ncbi:hypothetical protein GCM10017744_101900 [Streptomyces antimycoticus]|uniref:Uncharacterized protein n=1 Tax=Streptomyces antimycoticus TaxID=68175 RepID=A0A4D4KL29_9ACTN|nr:hypothetical protein SANT12839_101040 [Streptomyces antimycoticus]